MTNTDNYLSLPYTITVRKDEDGDFVARIDELQGCTAHGSTSAEAITRLEDVQRAWLADALEKGDPIPLPSTDDELPSGKWVQRVPRTLHRKVTDEARREGVSLNQFVATVLAEVVGRRAAQSSRIFPPHRWEPMEFYPQQIESIYTVVSKISSPTPIKGETITFPMETDGRNEHDSRN